MAVSGAINFIILLTRTRAISRATEHTRSVLTDALNDAHSPVQASGGPLQTSQNVWKCQWWALAVSHQTPNTKH